MSFKLMANQYTINQYLNSTLQTNIKSMPFKLILARGLGVNSFTLLHIPLKVAKDNMWPVYFEYSLHQLIFMVFNAQQMVRRTLDWTKSNDARSLFPVSSDTICRDTSADSFLN